jgi:hypothetical protein
MFQTVVIIGVHGKNLQIVAPDSFAPFGTEGKVSRDGGRPFWSAAIHPLFLLSFLECGDSSPLSFSFSFIRDRPTPNQSKRKRRFIAALQKG